MKMATEFLQGVPPLLKVCTYPLAKDNNQNFARGSTNDIFFGFFGQRDQVATRQDGVWMNFYFPLHFSDYIYFDFVRVFLPNTISIIRIVEYSTILVLAYFEYTLANVGLPQACLEWDVNCVTKIEKYLSLGNQIEKN